MLLFLGTAIIVAMLIITPRRYGDGMEYFMMTESLFNHLTPEAQRTDIVSLTRLQQKYPISHLANAVSGYFRISDNRSYCYHFWLYPLFALPAKSILHVFRLDEWKALQITNSLLLVFALCNFAIIANLSDSQKLQFSLLALFCPAFWFLRWPHPEIFSYSFVIISLAYMSKSNWQLATLSAAIASVQNQPLVILVVFLWIKGVLYTRGHWKYLLVLSLAAAPVFAPAFFYRTTSGTCSVLLHTAASAGNISPYKTSELFFDLNIGMLPYIPFTLLLAAWSIGRDIMVKKRITLNLQLILIVVIMMALCTATLNWNHGTSGPSRYVIWMLPLVFFIVVAQNTSAFTSAPSRILYASLLWLAIAMQMILVCCGGGFRPEETHGHHSYLARFILNHVPALYNPSEEIFIERTVQHEGPYVGPVIYRYRGLCRKALIKGKDSQQLAQSCDCVPDSYKEYLADVTHAENFIYIDYPVLPP